MSMRFKQSEQEYSANVSAVERKLLPSVLAATKRNGDSVASWLMKHRAEGELVDASVANILEGVVNLDKIGLIDWDVAPVKIPQKRKPDYLQSHEGDPVNHSKPQHASELELVHAEERRRRVALGDQEHREILAEAISLVRNHRGSTHAVSARQQEKLKAEFDNLSARKVHPRELLASLRTLQNSFNDSSIR